MKIMLRALRDHLCLGCLLCVAAVTQREAVMAT